MTAREKDEESGQGGDNALVTARRLWLRKG